VNNEFLFFNVILLTYLLQKKIAKSGVAEPDPFDTDPDPAFHSDPDQAFQFDTYPDPIV
jgi:hypothetical protein